MKSRLLCAAADPLRKQRLKLLGFWRGILDVREVVRVLLADSITLAAAIVAFAAVYSEEKWRTEKAIAVAIITDLTRTTGQCAQTWLVWWTWNKFILVTLSLFFLENKIIQNLFQKIKK